jgi:3-dehydroquinate dehydratase-2
MKIYRVLVLHGPNLNLLGEREPAIYGRTTLAQLNRRLRAEARRLGLRLRTAQRNGEGQLVDVLHRNRRWAHGVVINPGAYTHYSYALRDAIAAVGLPAVEVHLSDIRRREKWRRISVTAPACIGQRMGKGVESYVEGLAFLRNRLSGKKPHDD